MAQADEDALYTESPLTVAKVRLIEGVLGVFCHGLRVMALAPLIVALFASGMLALVITETHDTYLPPIVERLPANLQELMHDEDMTWDQFGKAAAAPLIFAAFGFSVIVGLTEQLTGLRVRRYAPKWWHWLLVLLAVFTALTVVTIRYEATGEAPVALPFIVILLNGVMALVASISVLGLWAVSRAETGTVEALHRRYGLVRADDTES